MISLLIETSTERGVVALFKGTEAIYEGQLPFGLQNSKNLFPEITKAFEVSKLTPSDLKFVVAGMGPGSYTGIRVAAMVAKSICFALQIPLIGVCSLEGFTPKENGAYASIIDARIGGVYVQTGYFDGGKITSLSVPVLYSLDEAVFALKDIKTLVTPNSLSLKQKFEKLTLGCHWNWIDTDPNLKQMIVSAFSKYEKGEFSLDGHLDLLYLRKTQAEIERNF